MKQSKIRNSDKGSFMTPIEIKIALIRAQVTQAELARTCGVSPTQIHRVIHGSVSDHVRRQIAKTIRKDVKLIWPEYYLRKQA